MHLEQLLSPVACFVRGVIARCCGRRLRYADFAWPSPGCPLRPTFHVRMWELAAFPRGVVPLDTQRGNCAHQGGDSNLNMYREAVQPCMGKPIGRGSASKTRAN